VKGTLTAQQLSVMDDMPLLGQRVDEATLPTPTTAVIYVEGADGSLHPAIWLKCGGKPSDLLAWFNASKRKLGELGTYDNLLVRAGSPGRYVHLTLVVQ